MAWRPNLCPVPQLSLSFIKKSFPPHITSSYNSLLLTDQILPPLSFPLLPSLTLLLLFLILIVFSFLFLKCMNTASVTLLASILHAMKFYNLSIVLCLLFYNKPQGCKPAFFLL